jgi:type IV pilus assembly protein PilZ
MTTTRTRQSPRVPVQLAVSYESAGEMARDVITNLSDGGLFIRTTRPLAIGTQIEMTIHIGEEKPPIGQKGRITWARGLPVDGMGVRFEPPVDPRLLEILKTARVPSKK